MTIFDEVRTCIEEVEDSQIRMFLKAIYLLGSAPVELAGESSPGTKIVYGPRGRDVSTVTISLDKPEFNIDDVNDFLEQVGNRALKADRFIESVSTSPIALFTIKNALKGRNWRTGHNDKEVSRVVAVPLLEKFEPWTKELHDYFVSKREDYVFPLKRVRVNDYVRIKNVFKHKKYQVVHYKNSADANFRPVPEHPREIQLYALRYIRGMELRDKYNFLWDEIEVYTGVKIRNYRTGLRVNQSNKPDWRSYIGKLCSPRKANFSKES
jgi:hypothetical protein